MSGTNRDGTNRRVRTLTNSSGELPTCVTALKRRSRKLSQQMLALMSTHGARKDEPQEYLNRGQTESQSWSSPSPSAMASRTTMGTPSVLNRLPFDRNGSADILESYPASDGQRDPRSTRYPPNRNRTRGQGHTPQSSYESSKYSREAPKQLGTQLGTSPTKPSGPRAPILPVSVGTPSQRRPLGISTDAHEGRRGQLTEPSTEYSPDSSAISFRNPGQSGSTSAPSTSRYPPESARRGFDRNRNTRPAIVASQDTPMNPYPSLPPTSPVSPLSAPPHTTRTRTPEPPRSKSTADGSKATTGRLPASPPQASPLHARHMSSDGIAGEKGSQIGPRRTSTRAHGGSAGSSARPRTPRDIGIVDATTHRPEHAHHTRHPSGQSNRSGSDNSENGQYANIDHPDLQMQQQQQQTSAAPSFDIGTDVDTQPVPAPFSLSAVPRPHPPRDYFRQQQPQQPVTTSKDLGRLEGGRTKANARTSGQGTDLRGSIAELWTSAVNAAEEEHRLEQLQKFEPPSTTNVVNVPSTKNFVNAPSQISSSRPGSRGREIQHQPQAPQMPAIVHPNSHGHSHNHHSNSVSQAGPLPSPPHHIAVKPLSPPPPRPPRTVTYEHVSVAPSNPPPSVSAHGSASSIALKRPPGSREPSPHKPRSHTPPSPVRLPPLPLARSPSPSKSPPPLPPAPARSVPPPPSLPPPPAKSDPPPIPSVPPPHDASSQNPIKTTAPLSLSPLSPTSNSINTNATANTISPNSLSVFARRSTSPVKPPSPLPPVIVSKSTPASATPAHEPAALVPAALVPSNPVLSLPDSTIKPRPRSPPPPLPPVKPLQLPMKNSKNNSPLPPPPVQLPSVPSPAEGKETTQENTHNVMSPHLGGRLSDWSIVAVSVKSGSTEGGTADDHEETKEVEVEMKVQVEVQGLQSADKRVGRVESSESEYSGSDSHESKVTSSTVAVAPIPSELQLEDKPADKSMGSLHIREAAESMFLQMHRVVNVGVEQPQVTTPTKITSMIEELDATPTRGNLANQGKAEPPAPAPAFAPIFSGRKEEVAHRDSRLAVYQPPPKSQPLQELKVELRPISGLMKDDDFLFHLSDAEPAPNRTFEALKRANYDHKDAKPSLHAPPPTRVKSGKGPMKGHARRENMSSPGSEYGGHPKEEKRTATRSPDFLANPFATPDPSRPATASTATPSSESATGHGTLFGWGPPPQKLTAREERARNRDTIIPGRVDEWGIGHGVEGDVEDEDGAEDEDEFEIETEHGRVLRRLVKEKSSWPSAMSFLDVISESTTAARARGYATKINELSQEDCGLKDWIEIWLKPKLFAGQLDIQISGVSTHGRVASGASVFSDTTFPMRFDAFRAVDLTPGAGGGPTELGNGPPPLPYPSLAMKQLQYGNTHRVKSNAHASNNLPKKSAKILYNIARKASMKSKTAGDSSGQETREKERVRRKLYRAPPSGSSASQLGSISDIGHSSSKASLVPVAPSIIGGPRAPPGKPKRASTVLVIGHPQLIHPPPPAQYPPNLPKRSSLDAFISAAASSSSTVAPHQPMSFQTNMIRPAPEGPRPVARTPSFPGHSSSSSSLSRGNGLAPPDANANGSSSNGPPKRSKLRQAVSYQPPKQPSDDGQFEKSLDKLCDFMPDVEREVLAGYLQQAGGQEMKAIGRIVDAGKGGAIAWP